MVPAPSTHHQCRAPAHHARRGSGRPAAPTPSDRWATKSPKVSSHPEFVSTIGVAPCFGDFDRTATHTDLYADVDTVPLRQQSNILPGFLISIPFERRKESEFTAIPSKR